MAKYICAACEKELVMKERIIPMDIFQGEIGVSLMGPFWTHVPGKNGKRITFQSKNCGE